MIVALFIVEQEEPANLSPSTFDLSEFDSPLGQLFYSGGSLLTSLWTSLDFFFGSRLCSWVPVPIYLRGRY